MGVKVVKLPCIVPGLHVSGEKPHFLLEEGAIRLKKSRKKKKTINIANRYLGMAAIALVVSMLFVFMVSESATLEDRLAMYEAKAAALADEIEAEKERTVEIEELKEHMLTDEYAEEVAREKLGLVKENEIVYEELE